MSPANQILVFDRALVRQRRDRAAAEFAAHNIIFEESAWHLLERLSGIRRDFETIIDLGAHEGAVARRLVEDKKRFVVAADISEKMLRNITSSAVVADEEFLPFAANSCDLVVSNLSLHWVNDLPGTLVQIKNILRPEGLFLASVLGGQTLHELGNCLMEAEMTVTGGASPRLSPVLDLQTASALLQHAGFALPVTDQEAFTLTYPHIFALMHDLRGMGETNAHIQRLRRPTRRAVFLEAARLYQERFPAEDGGVSATFEVLFLHGWKAPS
ncbi:MAG: methyltransferase domain-containing protein [Alphaproteobacteria bacterium]|nr:methyltransferase domain-containing protein [Alphaproteobacteria bacterium]